MNERPWSTVRLTTAQAVVRFLAAQFSERDGHEQPLFAGVLGIFGHGNVAGIGQALMERAAHEQPGLPYVLARNEQAMVHTAVGFAKQRRRLQTWACTASIGPGSTNMTTGAALATINRIPVLLLPSGTFATRASGPVLQELEHPMAGDISVNDVFRPVTRYFDRVSRPDQLPSALLAAMSVLTDPARTGAVALDLPQDVQAEAHDWPVELFGKRIWRVGRAPAEAETLEAAAALIRAARRPLIVAGGGVHYSEAEGALARLCEQTGVPVGETQAGKGSLLDGHPNLLGAIGSTGTTAANAVAAEADLVIGIGTRWTDFTTASRTLFRAPDVRFVNLNVVRSDAAKHAALEIVADARDAIDGLTERLAGWSVPESYRQEQQHLWDEWDEQVQAAYAEDSAARADLADGILTQGSVLGAVNEHSDPRDVVVCAAGSMPGDLHKLWRVRDHRGYHVEYGYSCMGYEIPAAVGVRMADPSRNVFAMVGDGGYLMMPTELVTAVQERVKIIVILVQNNGFGSIGALSQTVGSQRFGTRYRYRDASGQLAGDFLPVDLVANARSLGATVVHASSIGELHDAIRMARSAPDEAGPIVIHVDTDPMVSTPDSQAWWDVPVSEVSGVSSTREARTTYERNKTRQHPYVRPIEPPAPPPLVR